jgi:hypothetical protein
VEGEGFEPSKAEPTDLQSVPFDRSGTPPEVFFTAEPAILAGLPSHGQTRSATKVAEQQYQASLVNQWFRQIPAARSPGFGIMFGPAP